MTLYYQGKPEYYLYRGWKSALVPSREWTSSPSSRSSDDRRGPRREKRSQKTDKSGDNSKMTTGFTQFLRYATTIFTFIIFLAGAGILGLGIYVLGSEYGAKEVSTVLGNDLYQVAAYVLIATGALLVIMSICGCCGAHRESKCMLGVFVFFITILVLAQVAAAILVFVFREKMSNDVIHSMEDVLIKKYGVSQNNTDHRMVTDMWNFLQRELKCCGVTGSVNSTTSWAIYKMSDWYKGFKTGKPYVPESCCKPGGNVNTCTGIVDFDGPPTRGPPITSGMSTNPDLYTLGCYDELVHYIQDHAVIIGISSIAAVVLMLFGLTFSICLCRKLDYDYY